MNTDPRSIAAQLRAHRLDGLELRMLICAVSGATRVDLIAHDERILDATQLARLKTLVQRRLAGEPMAYILGQREFFGRSFRVTPEVLIPRPETELLVELALQRMPANARVLDLGTGSGAIAITLACERPDANVSGSDKSAAALCIARDNAGRLGAHVNWIESDWYDGVAGQRFDLLVSNPPYIAAGDAHLDMGDLRFEPRDALTDGANGLQCLAALIAGAPHLLASAGWLLLEHGHDQAEQVRVMLDYAGFAEVRSWRDLAGIERVSGGRGTGFAG